MKKIITAILAVAMLFSISSTVFASEAKTNFVTSNTAVQPRASLTVRTNSPRVSSSSFYTTIGLQGYGTADITLTLEKKSGSSWEYVDSKSWYGESFSNKKFTRYFSISESGTYRCVSYVDATVNGNSDSSEAVSSSFTK